MGFFGGTPDDDHVPHELWTQADQDQNDDSLPHCCGVCQDSPLGDVGQGLL